jgi:hypothetical protein
MRYELWRLALGRVSGALSTLLCSLTLMWFGVNVPALVFGGGGPVRGALRPAESSIYHMKSCAYENKELGAYSHA